MINRITSFFSQQRKNINLYFEEDKIESISIEITPEKTISQLYIENINKISVMKAKMFLKKKNYLSNNQQRKEYCFTLINKNIPFIRIKLKNENIPWEFLKELKFSDYSLFYISNDNYYYSFENNDINCRLNNLIKNRSQNEPKNNKPLCDETRIINFVSPENKIIDGEIEKFSYSDKKFKNKFIYVDSNKLMYKDAASTYQKLFYNNKSISPYNESTYIKNSDDNIYDTQNLWSVIPLSTIYSINKNNLSDLESLDIDIKKFSERLLVIRTFNKEKIIFRAQNNYTREKWFKVIRDIVEQVRIDKFFYQYNNEINEKIKELYLSTLKFIYKLFSIKGIIILNETRKLFFENSENKILGKIIEFCIEYKLNTIKKNNIKGYEQIKNLVEFLGYENFEEDNKCLLEKDSINDEIIKNKNEKIDKNYILKYLIDEQTHSKLINAYQNIRKRSLSFKNISNLSFKKKLSRSSSIKAITEPDILDNLYKNIMKKFLIKEHKKLMKNDKKFSNNLIKITAIHFCKHNNFNEKKMILLNQKDNEINFAPEEFSDLDEFL